MTPEAQEGGALAFVKDGDRISIDAVTHSLTLHISDDEMQRRRDGWTASPLRATQGVLLKYIRSVSTASLGCVTDG